MERSCGIFASQTMKLTLDEGSASANRRMFSTPKSLLFVLFLTLPASVFAQPDRPRSGLAVTGTVLSSKCLAWNRNLAEVRLRLQFRNTLQQPLILNKSDLEIETVKYFAVIDETVDKVHLGEFAVDRLRGYLPENDREIITARPNDHFVILRPRQAYVFETMESVPLIPVAPDSGVTKDPDEYQIQLEVATWVNHARPLAESLHRRWARFGMLWTQTVWSAPVKFVFPRNRTCEPE
jgi:hypothetical protein